MKRVVSWRPPLWLVAVLMGCTLALGTGAGYVQGAASSGQCTEAADVCQKFSNFWKVWNIAETEFLDPSAIDHDEMISGAINGMLDTLNDRGHTRYNTAEEYQEEREDQQGRYEGIGAYINQIGDYPSITSPIEGSPAEAAGIEAGDIILKIDGEDALGMSVDDVVDRVRGEPGTSVTLQVRHLDEELPVDITITRAAIRIPAVTWTMLPGNVAQIRLSQFSQNAKTEMRTALEEAREAGAQKLILDLRNNPGGLLDQAISVTSQFLPEDEVVLRIRGRDGEEEVYKANESDPELDLPMVVLINSGSASSSEIFASALQDHGRATILGVQTIGLGTVITPVPLEDGSAVYIGTAEWLTPNSRKLRHEGVKPDITVALPSGVQAITPTTARRLTPAEILETKDVQIQRALGLLGVTAAQDQPTSIVPR
ncbi:MAG TPA: S41 family peptidase [Herpetosiphonaceae bacterium]